MDVGMMMIFSSYGWEDGSDGQMWEEELRLAEIAADSGFNCLWSAEHHFNDYSFVPDNLQLMTHLAARHPGIDVGTAAVILPWHNPLRVAENAAVLDLLSNGRLRLGFGRGLARREFETFGISMDESRERFDEAAPMIAKALKTGFIEGNGKYYQQDRTEIRPRPQHSFDGRHLRGCSQRRIRSLGCQAWRTHHYVRRPSLGNEDAGHRARSGIAPRISRHGAA